MRSVSQWLGALLLVLAPLPASSGQSPYELTITLLPRERGVQVHGSLTIPAAKKQRDSVAIALSSWMKDVHWSLADGASLTQRTDSAEGDRTWWLIPKTPLSAGRETRVVFDYRGDSLTAPQLRVDSTQALFGGGGEVWYPRFDYDSVSTGSLMVVTAPGHTVVGTGKRVSTPDEEGRGVYRFITSGLGEHFAFASARYKVARARRGGPAVAVYTSPERNNGDVLADRVARMLDALSASFGPMPFEQYAVAEVRFGGTVGGTSEYGFFLADQSEFNRGLSLTLIGHEIGHTWWGNLVRTKPGPGRMMLTEAIASYGMMRVIRDIEGPDAAKRLRASRYANEELRTGAAGYFRLAAAGLELPLTLAPPRGQLETLRMHRMANTRGWFVYDMFARLVGDSAFVAFLRELVRDYAGKTLAWAEFQHRAEQRFGNAAGRFLSEWLNRAGAPDLELEWKRGGGRVAGTITQRGVMFHDLRVPVVAYRGSRRVATTTVTVSDSATRFSMTLAPPPDSVVLDPDYTVLRWTPEIRARATALASATRIEWLRLYGSRDSAVAVYRRLEAAASDSATDVYAARFQAHYQGGLALLATGDTTSAVRALTAAIEQPSREPNVLPLTYLVLARVSARQGNVLEAARWARAALSADALAAVPSGIAGEARTLLGSPAR